MSRSIKDRIVYFFEGIWLPIHANMCGLHHLIRGHKVTWFKDPDLWIAHLGWIYCRNCADTEEDENGHADLVIWGFHFYRTHRLLQKLCGFLGHKESHESLKSIGNGQYIPSGEFHCSRCSANVESLLSQEVV